LNSEILRGGRWPLNPQVSGYIDSSIKTGYASEAYYTKPVEILAELERRLKRTGLAGKLLRSEIKAGETIDSMEPEAKSALLYVKGLDEKAQAYSDWKKQARHRTKKQRAD